MSRRKPLSGRGLLAKCECFLKREKGRQRWHTQNKWRRVRVKKKPRRVQVQTPLDETKLAKNCERLMAYLVKERTASQSDCARAMHMTRQVWDNFLIEATWRLPLWEDDDGEIGLCK